MKINFHWGAEKEKMGGKKGEKENHQKRQSQNDEAILTRRKIVKGLLLLSIEIFLDLSFIW